MFRDNRTETNEIVEAISDLQLSMQSRERLAIPCDSKTCVPIIYGIGRCTIPQNGERHELLVTMSPSCDLILYVKVTEA